MPEPRRIKIKNWSRFQHYKHRCPPWIKLATDTFQNPDFARLQDASKLLAICIWTLAAKSQDGSVVGDFDYIHRWGFLGPSVSVKNLQELASIGFIDYCPQDASKLHTNAVSEAEGETETETEKNTPLPPQPGRTPPVGSADAPKRKPVAPPIELPEWLPTEPWFDYVAHRLLLHKPLKSESQVKYCIRDLEKLRKQGHDPGAVLAQSIANGWTGLFEIKNGGTHGETVADQNRRNAAIALSRIEARAASAAGAK